MAILEATLARGLAEAGATAIAVGLGEARALRAGAGGERSLVAYGLGSCVAVCLFDPAAEVAGMAHVVLPGADPAGTPNPKFARSALPALLEVMRQQGATREARRYVVKLAGGAQVLAIGGTGSLPRIGEQNARAVQEALAEAGLAVGAADLGGGRGRTVWFDPRAGGRIRVRSVGSGEREL